MHRRFGHDSTLSRHLSMRGATNGCGAGAMMSLPPDEAGTVPKASRSDERCSVRQTSTAQSFPGLIGHRMPQRSHRFGYAGAFPSPEIVEEVRARRRLSGPWALEKALLPYVI